MKSKNLEIGCLLLAIASVLTSIACHGARADQAAEAPPPAKVTPDVDITLFAVDHPEQFPLAAAVEHPATSELVVTGTVTPDITRNVPVVSLASGRVMAIHARLGDTVKKGQLLMTIRSDDVSGGYSTYRMAVADEILARTQYERSKDLYQHGAIALNDLQVAQDTEDKAKIAVETAAEHLRLLGNDPDKPVFMVDIFAPGIGGDHRPGSHQRSGRAGLQYAVARLRFPISRPSGLSATCTRTTWPLSGSATRRRSRLNAYPDRMFKGRVSNIGAILDPNIRTAKVRIEVQNPGIMRLGMFVKATFRGQTTEMHTIVPASAILHMHDRDFVFVPAPDNKFRRVEVVGGDLLPDNVNLQEIKSGLQPGQQVVTNALVLDHVLAQ